MTVIALRKNAGAVFSLKYHLVEADPTLSVAEIVNRFKGRTSRLLRQEYRHLRSRLVGARPWRCSKSKVHIHGDPTGAAAASHDAADHDPVGEHVVIVVTPLAGWAGGRGTFKD
jgi:Transposase IS200 like